MPLRVVTFDFWGTLYQNAYARDDRLRLLAAALESHGHRPAWQQLEEAYRHAWSVWDQVWREERRSISIDRWVGELLAHVEFELPVQAAEGLGRDMETVYLRSSEPRPVPGVTEVVSRLAGRFRLGLISDTGLTPGRVLRQVMDRDGLRSYFGALTFSDELGTTKPQPEPFLRTLRLLEAAPQEAVHVGDLPETDLKGALRVGMKAILFLGVSHREDGQRLADGFFQDYGELEELLERVGSG